MHIFPVDNVFCAARPSFWAMKRRFCKSKIGRLTQTLTGIWDIIRVDKSSIHWLFVIAAEVSVPD